jgi:hypothetical protein
VRATTDSGTYRLSTSSSVPGFGVRVEVRFRDDYGPVRVQPPRRRRRDRRSGRRLGTPAGTRRCCRRRACCPRRIRPRRPPTPIPERRRRPGAPSVKPASAPAERLGCPSMTGSARRAREFHCPRCGAAPGATCRSEDDGVWADHAERIALATGRPMTSGSRREPKPAIYIPEVAQQRRLPRELVRTVACPKCGAQPGELCFRQDGGPRRSNHAGRVTVAVRAFEKRSGGGAAPAAPSRPSSSASIPTGAATKSDARWPADAVGPFSRDGRRAAPAQ